MAQDDASPARSDRGGGLRELQFAYLENLAANQARDSGPSDRPQHEEDDRHRGLGEVAEDRNLPRLRDGRDDRQSDEWRRKRKQEIGQAHQDCVDASSHIPRDRPDRGPDQKGDPLREKTDLKRDARAMNQSGELVPSERIGAERVLAIGRGRWRDRSRCNLKVRIVSERRQEEWTEKGAEHEGADENGAGDNCDPLLRDDASAAAGRSVERHAADYSTRRGALNRLGPCGSVRAMNRDQLRFLAFGLLFGFVIGYIVAYGIYDDGLVQRAAPVPAAGNMGMSSAGPSSAAQGGMDGDALMQQVTGEISSLKEAIESDPNDQKALARLARLYSEVNMCDRAMDYYSRALELAPGEAHVRHEYAVCLRQLNRVDEALTEFRRALTDNPEHWETWLYIGIVNLRDKGDLDAASEAVTELEKLNPHYEGIPMLKDAIEKARTTGTSPSS